MITELHDTQLLARTVGEDLIAQETTYHLKCRMKLMNRNRSLTGISIFQFPIKTNTGENRYHLLE